ncbi:hypothetical protein COB64_01855 [Candidatus Wolfebacteria bacterium]|nr:MAG: hypothetical protein COB64_01855 [Candidatus Wolfebacteria bacterium]
MKKLTFSILFLFSLNLCALEVIAQDSNGIISHDFQLFETTEEYTELLQSFGFPLNDVEVLAVHVLSSDPSKKYLLVKRSNSLYIASYLKGNDKDSVTESFCTDSLAIGVDCKLINSSDYDCKYVRKALYPIQMVFQFNIKNKWDFNLLCMSEYGSIAERSSEVQGITRDYDKLETKKEYQIFLSSVGGELLDDFEIVSLDLSQRGGQEILLKRQKKIYLCYIEDFDEDYTVCESISWPRMDTDLDAFDFEHDYRNTYVELIDSAGYEYKYTQPTIMPFEMSFPFRQAMRKSFSQRSGKWSAIYIREYGTLGKANLKKSEF